MGIPCNDSVAVSARVCRKISLLLAMYLSEVARIHSRNAAYAWRGSQRVNYVYVSIYYVCYLCMYVCVCYCIMHVL